MKIFVIGGAPSEAENPEDAMELTRLDRVMQQVASSLITRGHDVIVCSPFVRTADKSLVSALASSGTPGRSVNVEFHFPGIPLVQAAVEKLLKNCPCVSSQAFRHPPPGDESKAAMSNAWLFAQVYALERCHAVLAIGGKLGGTTNLLLHLAEAKRKPVLPLPLLGGASEQAYWWRQFELVDYLGDATAALSDAEAAGSFLDMLEKLGASPNGKRPVGGAALKFFISYTRQRPQDADLVEMILRRRNMTVFRDERDFEAGNLVDSEIRNHLHQADVFIALYCREYACSPWCYDELAIASNLHKAGKQRLWLMSLDETRIVLPEARGVITLPAFTRVSLEASIINQLDRLDGASAP